MELNVFFLKRKIVFKENKPKRSSNLLLPFYGVSSLCMYKQKLYGFDSYKAF